MAYCPNINKAIIMTPKTGSNSVRYAMKKLGGYVADGHLPYRELHKRIGEAGYDADKVEYGVIVRDPIERIVSMFNAYQRGSKYKTLNQLMKCPFMRFPHVMFVTQAQFLHGIRLKDLKLLRFDTAWDWLGCEEQYQNVGVYKLTLEEIQAHPDYQKLLDFYDLDFKLWELAKDD